MCMDLGIDFQCSVHFPSMNVQQQDNITLGNYEEVLTGLSVAVRCAVTNEQEQTTNNLAVVAAAFARSAALINEMTIIPKTVSFC